MEHRYDPTSINHESVLMGQIPDDVDDVHNGLEDLFGSTAPTPNPTINLGDNNVAAEGEALPDATASTAASTGRERKCTSNVWEDMDKIFTTENGVRVRVGARCHFCKKELAARSTIGTGHLSRHREKLTRLHGRTGNQSMLRYNVDGIVFRWKYSDKVARVQLCRLIARLDLPLCFADCDAFDDYIKTAHNPRHCNVSRQQHCREDSCCC
jgi:hypothetical protein